MLKIFVNGSEYIYWTSAKVSRNLNNTTGSFSFTTSCEGKVKFPIKKGDKVIIQADSLGVINGFVRRLDPAVSNGGVVTTVSGSDKTCDVVDSSVPEGAKFIKESITIEGMCKRVISGLGANVGVKSLLKNSKPFSADEIESAPLSTNALKYLQSYARKRNAFTTTDGQGNLVLFYPPMGQSGGELVFKLDDYGKPKPENNIKSVSFSDDDSKRFNTYVCGSQDNLSRILMDAELDDLAKQVDRKNKYVDSEIRSSRYLEIQAEEEMNDEEVKNRAEEEANIRRGAGFNPKYTVHYHSMNGSVWNTGDMVNVHDECGDIYGSFLIETVDYTDNNAGGSVTVIGVTYPDTFTGKGGRSNKSKRTARSAFSD